MQILLYKTDFYLKIRCPHLGDWDEWMQAVRKDGVKYGPNKP